MQKKVILINPGKQEGSHYFPKALMVVAQALKTGGIESIIIDQRVEPDYKQVLQKNIDNCIFIGFSVMSGSSILLALEIAKYAKELRPLIPIVFGGYHPSCMPSQTVKHPLVDYVYVGGVKQNLIDFARSLLKEDTSLKIPGIFSKTYSNDISELSKLARGNIRDYDGDWRYGYQLLPDINKYRSQSNAASCFITLSCPYSCAFCSLVKMHKFGHRKLETVREELRFLISDKDFKNICFLDGHMFFGAKTRSLFEQLDASGLQFRWRGQARADSFDNFSNKDLEFFYKTGMRNILFGFESGSNSILKKLEKGHSVEQAVNIIKRLANYGISTRASFMAGIPGETIEDLKLTIDLINTLQELNANFYFVMFFYSPVPGSKTYHDMLDVGWKGPDDTLEAWADYGFRKETEKFPWMTQKEFDQYMSIFNHYFGENDYFGNKERTKIANNWFYQL